MQRVTATERKRKRAPHHTACLECHRAHRSCDGGRPCKRCVAQGKEAECKTPPKKERVRKRRTKNLWANEQTLSLSIFHQASTSTGYPSTLVPTTAGAIVKKPDEQHQPVLTALLQQIRQLNDMTNSLKKNQQLLSQQLLTFKSSQSKSPTVLHDSLSDGSDYSEDSFSTPASSPQSGSFSDGPDDIEDQHTWNSFGSVSSDLGYLVEYGTHQSDPVSNTQQDLLDIMDVTHESKLPHTPVPVSKDVERFKESLFTPFAIQDANKPFFVFKPIVYNWDLFIFKNSLPTPQCTNDGKIATCTILTVNMPFCALSQYPAEELVGESLFKLFPPIMPPPTEEHKKFVKYLMPQSPETHVSDVFSKTSMWQAKDGSIISGVANMQFFYVDGRPSFGVSSVVSFQTVQPAQSATTITPTATIEPIPETTPATPREPASIPPSLPSTPAYPTRDLTNSYLEDWGDQFLEEMPLQGEHYEDIWVQ